MLDVVLIGDPHLDKMVKLFGTQTNDLVIAEIRRVLAWADDNSISHVVILGDLCNKYRMTYDAHIKLLDLLFEWDGRLNVHMILGNHDYGEQGVHSMEILDVLYRNDTWKTIHIHSTSTQMEIDGVLCNFLAWPDAKPLPSSRQPLNFAHWETAGSQGDNGRILKEGVEADERHVFFNGHLHTPHDCGNVHYVGTLYQTSFGERLPKSFTRLRAKHVSGSKRLSLKVERIPFEPRFQLHNIVVDTLRDLDQVEDNPLWLYRLLMDEGVVLTDNWLADHPNVVKPEWYSTKQELQALQADEWVPADDSGVPILDERDMLHQMLVTHHGISAKKAQRAVKMLDTLINMEVA